jgi:hypothetical protein
MKIEMKGLIGSVALFVSAQALATPMYYTFEGNVSYLDQRDPIDVNIGDAVSYTFVIDFEAAGFVTDIDGVATSEYVDNSSADYFFADLLSGEMDDRGFYDPYIGEYNYGIVTTDGNYTLHGGNRVDIGNYSQELGASGGYGRDTSIPTISDWTVGLELYALDYSYTGRFNTIESRVTLTSICPTLNCNASTNVPEPSTIAIMALGLLGINFYRRKISNHQPMATLQNA